EKLPQTLIRDSQEAALSRGLAIALRASRGYAAAEVERAYSRAEMLCRRSGATAREMFGVVGGLQSVHQLRGPMRRASDLAERLAELAREVGDDNLVLQANRRIGWCMFCEGKLLDGRSYLERALPRDSKATGEESRSAPGSDPGVIALVNLAWLEWFLGYPDRAKAKAHGARLLSRNLGLPLSRAYAICMSAAVHQCIGDVKSTHRLAQSAIRLAEMRGFAYWRAWARTLLGWALAKSGLRAEGLAAIDRGMDEYITTGAELFRPYVLGLCAEIQLEAGDPDAALESISEGLLSSATSGARFFDADLHHRRGQVLSLGRGDFEGAEASYLKAAEIAKSQGARSLLLRAVNARATLPHRVDDTVALRDVETTHREFTEGFETPDLLAATSVLKSPSRGRGRASLNIRSKGRSRFAPQQAGLL
ncbi:MAG: hypothetical protein AAF637_26030, partial [Pseudomonadota bacterium]